MSEPEPGLPGRPDGQGQLGQPADVISGDELAARLLAVQQAIAMLDADSGVRKRLNLRFMSICTSLKLPGASADRGLRRLDQLMTDAERACHEVGKEV